MDGKHGWHPVPERIIALTIEHVLSALHLTLYPEDLMCTPLFVRVDFIRMKKDRSRELSGDKRLGLLDSTAQ